MPSHFQHRFRLSSTSATRFSGYGIVVFLGQALELLIQEDERVSGQRFTHRLFHAAVCTGNHFSAWAIGFLCLLRKNIRKAYARLTWSPIRKTAIAKDGRPKGSSKGDPRGSRGLRVGRW